MCRQHEPERGLGVSRNPPFEIDVLAEMLDYAFANPPYRPASDATASISISIFGFGRAWTTQVVRAG
jgi:hypothetical protein